MFGNFLPGPRQYRADPAVTAYDTAPDDDLVSRVAAGDSHALVALFRRRRCDIYRFALHMTGLESTAEDVTQEVFMVVIRDAARYDAARGSVTAWLCGIARNLLRRRLDRDRQFEPLPETGAANEPAGTAGDPLHDLAAAERLGALRRAVMSLPLRYREVVLLCDLQELSYAEAAAALDCAVGTVRSRLHRGRALLAAKLQHLAGHETLSKARSRSCFA